MKSQADGFNNRGLLRGDIETWTPEVDSGSKLDENEARELRQDAP